MAKKATLADVATGYQSNTTLNDNFSALNAAFDNTLSRDGSAPNDMLADLDMGGNNVVNAGLISATDIKVAGTTITDSVKTSEANAATSASEALSYLNEFKGIYYGSLSSDPTVDPLGNPPNVGDLYWNTTTSSLMVWDGTQWVSYDPAYLPAHTHPWGDITGTPTTLTGYGITDAAPSARVIATSTGLTGGGDLSTDRTLSAVTLPQTDWDAGTSTTEAVISPAKLSGAISALASGGTTITEYASTATRGVQRSTMTFTHSLGVPPKLILVEAHVVASTGDLVAGEVVYLNPASSNDTSTSTGLIAIADATAITLLTDVNLTKVVTSRPAGATAVTTTLATDNADLIVRAWTW